MSSLEYSSKAKDVLNRFYRVDYLMYVEGEDDTLFWEIVFSKVNKCAVKIKSVKGKTNLKCKVDEILSGAKNQLVAMDADFDFFVDDWESHPNILSTIGYSIENTLVTAETLHKICCSLGKVARARHDETIHKAWLNELGENVTDLVLHDIHNRTQELGYAVVGDNAGRFLVSKNSDALCPDKIERFLTDLPFEIGPETKKHYLSLIKARGAEESLLIRETANKPRNLVLEPAFAFAV